MTSTASARAEKHQRYFLDTPHNTVVQNYCDHRQSSSSRQVFRFHPSDVRSQHTQDHLPDSSCWSNHKWYRFFRDDLIQMIPCNDLTNHNKYSDSEASTPVSCFAGLWEFRLWEFRLRKDILWYGIMLIRIVFAVVSVVNIGYSTPT